MNEQSEKNKIAWEYRAYEFWNIRDGAPKEKAEEILKKPKSMFKDSSKVF